jgi:hypothetical protein
MLFDEKKVVFAWILVSVVVGCGFLRRSRQASVGMHTQEMQGGRAQA